LLRLPRERFKAIFNPVITPDFAQLAAEPVPRPWLQPDADSPVVLGVGRLVRQKDPHTLIRAVAAMLARRPVRLVWLDGPDPARARSAAPFTLWSVNWSSRST